jgi:hypothetical protein
MESLINPFAIVICILAVHRISSDMVELDGPFDIYHRWRQYLYENKFASWIQLGFNCAICLSFWISCILMMAVLGVGFFTIHGIVIWFAVAGGARLLIRLN